LQTKKTGTTKHCKTSSPESVITYLSKQKSDITKYYLEHVNLNIKES